LSGRARRSDRDQILASENRRSDVGDGFVLDKAGVRTNPNGNTIRRQGNTTVAGRDLRRGVLETLGRGADVLFRLGQGSRRARGKAGTCPLRWLNMIISILSAGYQESAI
jgi:hypothetical protein